MNIAMLIMMIMITITIIHIIMIIIMMIMMITTTITKTHDNNNNDNNDDNDNDNDHDNRASMKRAREGDVEPGPCLDAAKRRPTQRATLRYVSCLRFPGGDFLFKGNYLKHTENLKTTNLVFQKNMT